MKPVSKRVKGKRALSMGFYWKTLSCGHGEHLFNNIYNINEAEDTLTYNIRGLLPDLLPPVLPLKRYNGGSSCLM